MENKQDICKAFVPVLQMTRAFDSLVDLIYEDTEHGEAVTPVYSDNRYAGYLDAETGEEIKRWCGPSINVTADSGIAMLYDIMRALWKEV